MKFLSLVHETISMNKILKYNLSAISFLNLVFLLEKRFGKFETDLLGSFTHNA